MEKAALMRVVSNGIKDTNLKANHNLHSYTKSCGNVVSNGIKDTNLKANHNNYQESVIKQVVVSNGIKDTNLKANHNTCILRIQRNGLFPMVSKILI